jgi:hypothetical protein
MNNDRLFALIKSVDPEAKRVPPGIAQIAQIIGAAARREALEEAASELEVHPLNGYAVTGAGHRFAKELRDLIDQTEAAPDHSEEPRNMVAQGERAAKFFTYDADNGFQLCDTAEAARDAAQAVLKDFRTEAHQDGEWAQDVEDICWGVVLGDIAEIELPDDGYDGGQGLAGYSKPVDYKLVEVRAAMAQQGDVYADTLELAQMLASDFGYARLNDQFADRIASRIQRFVDAQQGDDARDAARWRTWLYMATSSEGIKLLDKLVYALENGTVEHITPEMFTAAIDAAALAQGQKGE